MFSHPLNILCGPSWKLLIYLYPLALKVQDLVHFSSQSLPRMKCQHSFLWLPCSLAHHSGIPLIYVSKPCFGYDNMCFLLRNFGMFALICKLKAILISGKCFQFLLRSHIAVAVIFYTFYLSLSVSMK